mgnify:CR=1 FL=1
MESSGLGNSTTIDKPKPIVQFLLFRLIKSMRIKKFMMIRTKINYILLNTFAIFLSRYNMTYFNIPLKATNLTRWTLMSLCLLPIKTSKLNIFISSRLIAFLRTINFISFNFESFEFLATVLTKYRTKSSWSRRRDKFCSTSYLITFNRAKLFYLPMNLLIGIKGIKFLTTNLAYPQCALHNVIITYILPRINKQCLSFDG